MQDAFEDKQLDRVMILLYQVFSSGSEYNQKTFAPFIACLQVLFQEPIVFNTYVRRRQKPGQKARLFATSFGLPTSAGYRGKGHAKEFLALFRDPAKRAANIERYAFPSPFGLDASKYEFFFVLFRASFKGGRVVFKAIDRKEDEWEKLRCLFARIKENEPYASYVRDWFVDMQESIILQEKRSPYGPRKKHSFEPISKHARNDAAITSDGFRIIYDVIDSLYERLGRSRLIKNLGDDLQPKFFVFVRHYSLDSAEDKDAQEDSAEDTGAQEHYRWVLANTQRQHLTAHLNGARQAAPRSVKTNDSIERIHRDVKGLSFWLDEVFSSGHVIYASEESFPKTKSEGAEEDRKAMVKAADTVFRAATDGSYRLALFPVWLSGIPYAVLAIPIPVEGRTPEDLWLYGHLICSEIYKANFSRRLRARIRDRYQEQIYTIAVRTFAANLSTESELFKATDKVEEDLDRYHNEVVSLSRFFPFDIPKVRAVAIDGPTPDDLLEAPWIGRVGDRNLFMTEHDNPFYQRRFPRSEGFIQRRGKNALRRALRDSRIRSVRGFGNFLAEDDLSLAAIQISSSVTTLLNRKENAASLVFLEIAPGSAMLKLASELAYAVHLDLKNVTPERIRLFAPALNNAENDRFQRHLRDAAYNQAVAVERLERRTQSVVVFLDSFQKSAASLQRVAPETPRVPDLTSSEVMMVVGALVQKENSLKYVLIGDRASYDDLLNHVNPRAVCHVEVQRFVDLARAVLTADRPSYA